MEIVYRLEDGHGTGPYQSIYVEGILCEKLFRLKRTGINLVSDGFDDICLCACPTFEELINYFTYELLCEFVESGDFFICKVEVKKAVKTFCPMQVYFQEDEVINKTIIELPKTISA